jgi:hypothetical protein
MRLFRPALSTLIVFSLAAFAVAQNADKNSAGPTKNDYRLRVLQPVEGAKITGKTVQVVVDRTVPAERDVPTDVNSMPRPLIDVFLDEKFQSSMPSDANVVDLEKVAPGPHTITILAKTRSGEVIDRKVIAIVAMAEAAPKPAVVEKAPVAPPPPAPAVAPPPEPAAPAAEPSTPAAVKKMPRTATSQPLLAIAGVVLVLGGIALRRLG